MKTEKQRRREVDKMPYYCYMRKKQIENCDGKYTGHPCMYPNYCGVGFKSDKERIEMGDYRDKMSGKTAWDTYRKYHPHIPKK